MLIENTQNTGSICKFSIVIPVLNEADRINSLICHLRTQSSENFYEIIVVDGDPRGGTIKVIHDGKVITITADQGRARQMNAGAATAGGEVLIFLHADTLLPPNALNKISRVLENDKYVGGAFNLGIDSDRILLKYVAAHASIRSRINRIPYGDQTIFIRKSYFDKIGRFKEIPLMEDVDLMRRIKKRGDEIYILSDQVMTSPRRWEKEGVIYTTIRNRILTSLYFFGVGPEKLVKYYRRHSE
ncbi:MAG TPA: TIGR04283 family arsenosugar biosynthesis glycosyltransferase [Sedimentisphaerales bacterium]|nr:TIGR04283 family arsenosugar biosynthesis glycosyltransferase [Sedimentisphaerales bacterium]